MTREEKITLVGRLLENGSVTFKEALALLESDTAISYAPYTYIYPYKCTPTGDIYCGTSAPNTCNGSQFLTFTTKG